MRSGDLRIWRVIQSPAGVQGLQTDTDHPWNLPQESLGGFMQTELRSHTVAASYTLDLIAGTVGRPNSNLI